MRDGQEANVFVYGDDNNRHVVKVINYSMMSDLPSEFIDNRIALYNGLFPESRYELLGFTERNDGNFCFVVKQPFIERILVGVVHLNEQNLLKLLEEIWGR